MADHAPTLLASKPGIKRDGTRLSTLSYVDGRWVRFDAEGVRKMGGYAAMTTTLTGVSRGLHDAAIDGTTYIHSGSSTDLNLLRVNLITSEVMDPVSRIPGGFNAHADHIWTFDAMQDVVDGEWKIIAHAAPNAINVDNSTNGAVYIGKLNDTAQLVPIWDNEEETVPLAVSGGICAVHPFCFFFGNNGDLIVSVSNKPSDVLTTFSSGTNTPAAQFRPTSKKIVAGRATRGGTPTALLWSLDTLVRASFTGGAVSWDFDPLASIEILSAKSLVEYNGVFFWIGAGRFLMYAGQVQDVPNSYNKDWFFKNLTPGCAGRIFAFTVPQRGEIWWCAPMFGSTECNHAVIMNMAGHWYDTPLPGKGRTAALSPSSTFPHPILGGIGDASLHTLWKHETGVDEIIDGQARAIKSYYTTSDITLLRGEKPSGNSVEVMQIEPDFVQNKDLTVTVLGNANARAMTEISDPVVIPEIIGEGAAPAEQIIELRGEHRQMRFRFESNDLGGYFESGMTYGHIKPTQGRETT